MATSTPGSEVKGLLELWRSPVKSHTQEDLATLGRLAEAAKCFLKRQFYEHLGRADSRPLLLAYIGDGTPVQTKVNFSLRSKDRVVHRAGYSTKEYYVHNCFAMYKDEAGKPQVCVLLRDPVPMTEGKTVAAAAAIGLDFLPNPRERGHAGPIVRHVAFDRAQFGALQKVFRRWITKQALQPPSIAANKVPGQLLMLLDWCVQTPCSLHDVHKSLFWSMHHSFPNSDLLKNVFVAIEGCRKSFAQITDYAPRWLSGVLSIEPEDRLEAPEVLRDLWLACGADADLIGELVDLRLLQRGDRIVVRQGSEDKRLFERVLFCMFSIWRLRRFNESRWGSVGAACRSNIGARLCGLGLLVETILKDPAQSNFHIGGFSKAGKDELEFMTVAALSCYPTDAALLALVADTRLVKRLEHLVGMVEDEMRLLIEMDDAVWDIFARVCGWHGRRLRSQVLTAAHCSIAGMHWRVFSEVRKYPWRLAQGDINANLQRLREEGEPEEPTTAKIWHLLQLGWNAEVLKEAVGLLAEVAWGTKVAEEQHASAAVVTKYHPEMSEDAVCIRAFLHTCRNFLPTLSDSERHLQRMELRLQSLERKRPQNIRGRQVFISRLIQLIKLRQAEGLPVPHRKKLVKASSHLWGQTNEADKQRYEHAAQISSAASQSDLQETIVELQDRRNIEIHRVRGGSSGGRTAVVVVCCEVHRRELRRPRATVPQQRLRQRRRGEADESAGCQGAAPLDGVDPCGPLAHPPMGGYIICRSSPVAWAGVQATTLVGKCRLRLREGRCQEVLQVLVRDAKSVLCDVRPLGGSRPGEGVRAGHTLDLGSCDNGELAHEVPG